MTTAGGNACCNTCTQNVSCCSNNGFGSYAFVLVLFILLVICGAAFMF